MVFVISFTFTWFERPSNRTLLGSSAAHKIYAIMPIKNPPEDKFTQAVISFIKSYEGVKVLVVCEDMNHLDTPELRVNLRELEQLIPIIRVRGQKPGVSSARNAGLELIKEGMIVLLDSDDLLEPNSLDRLREELDQSDSKWAIGQWRIQQDKLFSLRIPHPLSLSHVRLSKSINPETLIFLWETEFLWPVHSVLFKSGSHPFFMESLSLREDMVFWGEFLQKFGAPAVSPERVAIYRRWNAQTTSAKRTPEETTKSLSIASSVLLLDDSFEKRAMVFLGEHHKLRN